MCILEGKETTEEPSKKDIRRELRALVDGETDAVMLSKGNGFIQGAEAPGTPGRLVLEYHPHVDENRKDGEYFRLRAPADLDRAQGYFEQILDSGRLQPGREWEKVTVAAEAGRTPGSRRGKLITFSVLAAVIVGGASYAAHLSHAPVWEGALYGGAAVLAVFLGLWLAVLFFERWIPSLGRFVGRSLRVPVVIGGRHLSVWPEDRRTRAPGRLFLVRLTVFVAAMAASLALLSLVVLLAWVASLVQR